jgi:hypothetical protein
MEILCINDQFTQEQIEFYQKFNVTIPKEGKLYSIRKIIFHPSRGTGLLLNEIINPLVPIKSSIGMGAGMIEPDWNSNRFSTLQGEIITREELRKIKKEINEKIQL